MGAIQQIWLGSFFGIGYLAKLSSRFEVEVEVLVDPVTGNEATIYACRKAQRKAIDIPRPKNDEKFEDFDAMYYSRKARGLAMTYAQYMTRLEYRDVADGTPHPSLGGNVPDRDEKGTYNFNLYGKLTGNITPATRVLEYGCGTLRIGEKFMAYLDSGNYFGLDVQPGFVEIGKCLVPKSLLESKDPILTDTSSASIERAVEFGADFIYSNSVAFHVHQDDLIEYFGNLARIASKPGAILIFDAKIAEEATRYNHSGWAWPLDLYKQLLQPLIFVRLIGDRPYAHAENCVVAHLEFRRPE